MIMANQTVVKDYVSPNNAGLQSEPAAVGRRIAKLLNSSSELINRFICEGQIETDCWEFRQKLISNLRESGWVVEISEATDKFLVRPPRKDF